jgi:opacity protein-like surface antigen
MGSAAFSRMTELCGEEGQGGLGLTKPFPRHNLIHREKTMKHKLIVSGVLLLFACGLAAPAAAQSRTGFRLGGGLGYFGGGDLNTGIQGMSDLYSTLYQAIGVNVQNGYKPVHLGMDLNGEFFFHLSPEFAIGFGVGYLSMAKDSSLDLSLGTESVSIGWKPKIQAIPLTLNLHYYIPVGGRVKLVVSAGAGFYMAKIDFTQNADSDTDVYKMSANGFGAHGGLGMEVGLSSNVSLVIDLLGRLASISGFTGDHTWSGGTEAGGKFYHFEGTFFPYGTFPILTFSDSLPTGSTIANAREAKLDLSGFSAIAGFLFRF